MTWTIVVAAVITIAVLGVGGAMTDVGLWYRNLRKPSWNPPDWLFGPAWALILGLATWAGVLGWTRAMTTGQHVLVAILFGANIVLHMQWRRESDRISSHPAAPPIDRFTCNAVFGGNAYPAHIGVSNMQSSRYQALASIPDQAFEDALEAHKNAEEPRDRRPGRALRLIF